MPIAIQCPFCKRQIGIPDGVTGGAVRCPLCATVFAVPTATQIQLPPQANPAAPTMPPAPAQPSLQSQTQPARANLLDTLGIRQLLPDNPNTRKYLQIGAVLVVGLAFIGLVSVVMCVGVSFLPSRTSDGQKPGAEEKAKPGQEQKTFDATEIPGLVQSGKLQKLDGQRITVTGPLAVQPMGLNNKNGNFVMGYLISTSKGITHNNEDNWLSVLFLDKRNNKLSAEFLQLSQRLRPGDLVTVTGNVSYKGGKLALYDAELIPVR